MSNTPLPERIIITYVEGERGTYPIYKDGYTESQMHAHAAAVSAAKDARIKVLEDALRAICSEQDARQGYASVETYDAARAALGDKPTTQPPSPSPRS